MDIFEGLKNPSFNFKEDSMKIYHIERDYNISLKEQKKQLEREYKGFQYLYADRGKMHFIAEGKA